MGKTSPTTGTGKKAQKAEYKAHKFAAEEYVKEGKANRSVKKGATKEIQGIAKGKHGVTGSLSELNKRLERGGKYAEEFYAPIAKQAEQNYNRYIMPDIANKLGSESGSRSSALNQALAAGRVDLQGRIASDFASFKTNLAQNMVNQSESNKLANLNARLQSNQTLRGSPTSTIQGGIQNSYNASSNSGPNGYQQAAGSLLKAGATIAGTIYGGPAGGVAANQTASWGTNQLGLS